VRILIVEDEPEMVDLLKTVLAKQDFVADGLPSIAMAEEAIELTPYDLILIDRNLRDGDGATLLSFIRHHRPNTPTIVISAKGSATDRIEGLNMGADDYLPKPFPMDELIARIRAVLRRPNHVEAAPISMGNVSLDLEHNEVLIGGVVLDLPRREYLVLESLMRRSGRTVRRALLEDEVYGADDDIQSNSLEAHISRLRRKMTEAGSTIAIHPVRGVGYLLKRA
jgi:two-component system OmpR family response regulator